MRRLHLLISVALALGALLLASAAGEAADTSIKAGADQGIEQGMVTLVNSWRAQHGLPALRANNALMHAARAHSRDMVEHDYFDHTSQDGEQFSQRLSRFGFHWQSAGEAIGEASGLVDPSAAADQAVMMWRQSPMHNRILLTGSYRAVGIGAWCTEDTGGGSTCLFTLDAARS
jgi:uncharacterized protein YkwD